MSQKRPSTWGNPDRRHQTQFPAPAIEQIESLLFSWLSPGSFKPLRDVETQQKLRDRLLTLPVMMAVVVSLVYRRIPSLSEVLRVLEVEGLLWVEPLKVTKQALSKRLASLPAQLFAQVFEQVMDRMQATQANLPVAVGWEGVHQNFTAVWIADGSTLEALKKKLQALQWGKTWYYYLTNVLDPQQLSTQQVCELYRRRWRIEEAFLLTKRLLGLAYLWVGGTNGVQIQIFATWIFYAVLNDLCSQVAVALNQPKECISVEMVFRSLYHFARAFLRGDTTDVVTYLVEHYKLLGLVKAQRKRHRDKVAHSSQIWAASG